MILLRELDIHNFLSHKESHLLFNEGDKVLLDGVSGSGKSSVIDALLWVLYGAGRVENKSLVRRGAKEAHVRLVVSDGPKHYAINRKTTSGGKHSLEVSEIDSIPEGKWVPIPAAGLKETQKYIEEVILHCSYELFINSVAYPQGNRESFVNASSARRKELLLEILKTADIGELLEKTKNRITTNKEKQIEVQGSINLTERLINDASIALSRETEIDAAIVRKEEDIVVVEADVVSLTASYNQLEKLVQNRAETTDKMARRDEIKGRLSGVSKDAMIEAAKEVEPKIAELVDAPTKLDEAFEIQNKRSSVQNRRPTVRDFDFEIQRIDAELAMMQKKMKCPAGDACPFVKEHGPHMEALTKTRAQKLSEKEAQSIIVAEWEAELMALPIVDISNLREDVRKLGVLKDNLLMYQLAAKDLEELETLEKELGDVTPEGFPTNDDLTYTRNQLTEKNNGLKRMTEELGGLRAEKQNLGRIAKAMEKDKGDLVEYSQSLAVLRDEAEKLAELREAFGTNGIQAVALDYLLPSLESKVNEILSQLSDFRIRLDTQRVASDGESKVEGLFIIIRNDQNEELAFESYSGGEKLKITVAISEALATLQNMGFRILDELFVGLDEDSTDSFAHVLAQVQGRFSQMICVSHLRQIKDLFDKQIEVRKLDGLSTITL